MISDSRAARAWATVPRLLIVIALVVGAASALLACGTHQGLGTEPAAASVVAVPDVVEEGQPLGGADGALALLACVWLLVMMTTILGRRTEGLAMPWARLEASVPAVTRPPKRLTLSFLSIART